MSIVTVARKGPRSLVDLLTWCEMAPAGLQVSATWLAEQLRAILDAEEMGDTPVPDDTHRAPVSAEPTWRERIWTVPDETRLTVDECAEALGRSRAWLYARGQELGIPYRLEGAGGAQRRVYLAGELRDWVRRREMVVVPGSLARQQYASAS